MMGWRLLISLAKYFTPSTIGSAWKGLLVRREPSSLSRAINFQIRMYTSYIGDGVHIANMDRPWCKVNCGADDSS